MDQNKHKKQSGQMVSFHPLTNTVKEKSAKKVNSGVGKHVCDECGKSYRYKLDLKRHVDGVHLKLKPFKCEHCDESFDRSRNLIVHSLNQHENNRYQCDKCDANYSQKGPLVQHIRKNHHY